MKTVYFIGAGFAKDAGVPLQSQILPFILDPNNRYHFEKKNLSELKKFLENTYNLDASYFGTFNLEDIFTPIDRCISENIPLRGIGPNDLREFREIIYNLIGNAIKFSLDRNFNDGIHADYLDRFAEHLVYLAKKRLDDPSRKVDSVGVISTNWDITIDGRLHSKLKNEGEIPNRQLPKGVVDYCCHISSWQPEDIYVKPGLEVIGAGGFNVKLLKLHGSLNWVKCSRCQRTYVDFDDKIAMRPNLNYSNCRHCQNNFQNENANTGLVSDLIMPTYLKDLSNTQYKLIWQNAGIELSEATRLVFIGYSLPEADFEIRQLLRRMMRNDAEVICVTGGNNPEATFEKYRRFFGREITTFDRGARDFVLNNLEN